MAKKIFRIDFNKAFKPFLIAYAAVFIAGIIVAVIFGVNLDINFRGGARLTYSYKGDIDLEKFEKTLDGLIEADFEVSQSTSLAGDSTAVTVNLVGRNSLTAEKQEEIIKSLTETFPDNNIELRDSNSVSPSIAGAFFVKSMVTVLLTAVFVIIYVGFRFRRIGGISAGITALVALVLDVLFSFFTCVFFRLQIDSNYIAVVLTLLGYSLNDTIVIYDRVRENKKLYPSMDLAQLVNDSLNVTAMRNIMTALATFLAVMTIVLVSELYGITSLRTFAIPMAFGIISGSVSSMFISAPLWVIWKNYRGAKVTKK